MAVRADQERVTTQAWLTAMYHRAKRLPRLQDELAKLRPGSKPTPEVVMTMLAGPRPDVLAAWGGE